MTVDPKWLMEKASGGVVAAERRCVCGYSLKGLKTGGKCPECGRAIPGVAKLNARSLFKLEEFSARVLNRLARGTTMMAAGMWLMTPCYLGLWLQRGINVSTPVDVSPTVPIMILLLGVLPGALMWLVGVVMLCGADAGYSHPTPSPANLVAGRPWWFRPMMVLGQLLWPAGAAMAIAGIMVEDVNASAGLGLMLVSVGAAVLASLLMPPVCLTLKELAILGQDDYAANRFHGLTLGIPIVGTMLALLPAWPFLLGLSRGGTFVALLGMSVLLSPGAYLFLRALGSLASTCRWARTNAQLAAERDERFVERSRRGR